MPTKFQATYRLTVYAPQKTVIIEYPLTIRFNVTKGLFSESNRASIQVYNLSQDTRQVIFQDIFQQDESTWKYVHLEAGYGSKENMSLIFKGRIMTAYSHKSGGQTDIITEIEAVELGVFESQTSRTIEANTDFREAYKLLASDMKGVIFGNLGNLQGKFLTPTTFDGTTYSQLNKLTGGNTYVDNGVLNTLMNNEVLKVPVPVITNSNALLETPIRRDANLDIKMLFEPTLVLGQLLEIKSGVAPNYDGQYKVIGYTHDCLISPTQGGQRITTVNLLIADLLPASDIALTGGSTQNNNNSEGGTETGAAASIVNEVEGEAITPLNPTATNTNWIMPCKGRISSGYGKRVAPKPGASTDHNGLDFAIPTGTAVKAIADGKVIAVGPADGYGYWVALEHGKVNGVLVTSEYGHISKWTVAYGQKVKQGQIIALSGNTGTSTGEHLHLTVREGPFQGKPVSPFKYIPPERY